MRVDGPELHMGDHHGGNAGVNYGLERHQVGITHVVQWAINDRQAHMGVNRGGGFAGEVLGGGGHTCLLESAHLRYGEGTDPLRVNAQGAHADRWIVDIVCQVNRRCQIPVDAQGVHLLAQHFGCLLSQRFGICCTQRHRAGTFGEAFPQARHNAAFLVNGDQKGMACCGVQTAGEGGYLRRVFHIAGEQDHAPNAPFCQPLQQVVRRFQAMKAHNHHLADFLFQRQHWVVSLFQL